MKVFNAWLRRIFLIGGIGLLLILMMDLNKRMIHMIQLRGEMESEQEKSVELSSVLGKLESQINYAKSDEYAAEWAREQNMMRMEGDTVVVLLPDGSYEASAIENVDVIEPEFDNWEAWKLWLTFHE